jgi:hypothetical protein
MRSANPLTGIGDVDVDELGLSRSHFEERRLAMKTRTTTPRDRVRTRQEPTWRPALIAASAFVLVVVLLGAGTAMLRGTEADTPVAGESAVVMTTVSTTPTATTTPKVVVAPEATAIDPGVRILSNVPEYGTNLVLGADGFPMLLSTTRSGDEYPGTARLFRCADVACDEVTVEALEYQPGSGPAVISGGATDALIVGPNGDVYITLESADALQSVGRYDGDTVEPLPALSSWAEMPYTPLPAAFDNAGNPVFVVFTRESPTKADLLVCEDPLCGGFARIELDRGYDIPNQFPAVFIDENEARVVYGTGERTGPLDPETGGDGAEAIFQTKVATIVDLYTSPHVSTQLIYEGLNAYLIDAVVTDNGEPVAWIWQWMETETPGEPSQAIITIACGDQSCNEFAAAQNEEVGPLMIGEIDTQMRPIAAYVETVYDPDEYSAYLEEVQRIADEGLVDVGIDDPEQLGVNIVVTQCSDTACTSAERTTIAAFDVPWWYLGSFELEVAPDGTVLVAIAGVGEYSEPGLRLYVFPDGELGPGVEPVAGHVVIGDEAR